jgi:nucleoside-diphosphate-sugar epimerase
VATGVLITGASGLLGRWTLHHWPRHMPPPATVDHRDYDLLSPGTMDAVLHRTKPDVVIHLGWVASGTPGYRNSPNNDRWLEVSLELARSCRETGTFLYCTGSVVDDDRHGPDRYTAAKARLRELLAEDVQSGRVGWLRPHYVFDPSSRRPAVVAAALDALDTRSPLFLRSPDERHDFVHASDVGSAIVATVEHRTGGTIDIGCGRARPVKELLDALGVPWHATPDRRAYSDSSTEPASIRPLKSVGWRPTITEEFFSSDRS